MENARQPFSLVVVRIRGQDLAFGHVIIHLGIVLGILSASRPHILHSLVSFRELDSSVNNSESAYQFAFFAYCKNTCRITLWKSGASASGMQVRNRFLLETVRSISSQHIHRLG